MCVCVCVTLTDLLRQRWELVDVLAGVLAARHAEAKLEIEALEQLIAKVMSLNHAEVVDGRVPHCELHSADTPGTINMIERKVIKEHKAC